MSFVVGETDNKEPVLAATNEPAGPDTLGWLATETEDQARPISEIAATSRVVYDVEPFEYVTPDPQQLLKDLGWDDETAAEMAAARHAADPIRYPTLESATYQDPEPEPAATAPEDTPEPTPAG